MVVYTYFGYPLLLALLGKWRRNVTKTDPQFFPRVSLIIAAHNEEKVLRRKLENSLALDYAKNRLEIIVASDGSTDRTNAIAKTFGPHGVVLHEIAPRGGKTRAINMTVPKTHGDIVVLSDANTMYKADAIRKLVQYFVDPKVGAVSGDVQLINAAESHARSEGFYYRYERWIQKMESNIGSIIGADGGMYAVARHCFQAPSDRIIVDDFVISMNVARKGYRVLYEADAIAVEEGTSSSREEFWRKVRIVAGGVQAFKLGEGLPRLNQPVLLLSYISHKLIRWLVPCFLIGLFVSSLVLSANLPYKVVFVVQLVFVAIALLYATNIFRLRRIPCCGVPFYFCLVNGAALYGLCKGLIGAQTVLWPRTAR